MRTGIRAAVVLLTLILAIAPATAENSTRARGYTVHHNAVPASMLTPEVATRHGVVRSRYRGLLTVSVIQETANTTGRAVPARIQAEAKSLTGRVERLEMREVTEGDAVYYLATFPVTDGDDMRFSLEVTPRGEALPITASFSQQFFID